jgi:hypothetical protein
MPVDFKLEKEEIHLVNSKLNQHLLIKEEETNEKAI